MLTRTSLLLGLLVLGAGTVALPRAGSAQTHLTTAANVRVRAAPSDSARIVTHVPLGTSLVRTASAVDAWMPVRLPAGGEGWIHTSLLAEADSASHAHVAERIVVERLAREDDGFDARAELVAFIERVLDSGIADETAGRFALLRLRALDAAFERIPFLRRNWWPALQAFIDERGDALRYNEPGGMWMVRNEHILDVHARYRDTEAADDIAWFMVGHGLGGECEGWLPCYIGWHDRLEGEYLRLHPRGAHVQEVLTGLGRFLEYVRDNPGTFEMAATDCADFAAHVSSLRQALAGTGSAGADPVVRMLDEIERTHAVGCET